MNNQTTQFGEHITLDGYGGNPSLLDNQKLIISILTHLPQILGMKPLSAPLVLSAPDNGIKDPGGWTGFVIIAESHISIHTFPRRGFLSADIYTCKSGMDLQLVIDYFTKAFDLDDVETNFIKRGTRYPVNNINNPL
jgi:S-adenosylmethionine decarboxylase